MKSFTRRAIIAAAPIAALGALSRDRSQAAPVTGLPQPKGSVLLTVSGSVPITNGDGSASFDLSMLDALPQVTIVTSTPWYKSPVRFDGPSLAAVLGRVGLHDKRIGAHAINDYEIDIPAEDASLGIILATRRDGEPMPLRDKGPIFAMYPFDEHPALKSQIYYSRCIWQLERLTVE